MNKLIALLLPVFVAGCAAPSVTPKYDARFGDAVREARLRMTLNPNAGRNPDAVIQGTDGRSAAEAYGRYQDSFKAPPPVVNVINIGGAIGGGK